MGCRCSSPSGSPLRGFCSLCCDRARSVFERAIDVNHRSVSVWLKYAEIEMKNRQVNHARNILDRAITILPRVNQFWYRLPPFVPLCRTPPLPPRKTTGRKGETGGAICDTGATAQR
jgi:hypothetical protein